MPVKKPWSSNERAIEHALADLPADQDSPGEEARSSEERGEPRASWLTEDRNPSELVGIIAGVEAAEDRP